MLIIFANLLQSNRELGEVKDGFIEAALNIIREKATMYDDFIFGMIVATFLWLLYHRFIGLKYVKKSYEIRLDGKDETIKALKILVYERLDKVDIPELKTGTWAKIKKSFNIK